jgi:hypothetical protein
VQFKFSLSINRQEYFFLFHLLHKLQILPIYGILYMALPATAGGYSSQKGGMPMVDYPGLFQFCLVILGVVALVIRTKKK